MNKTQLVSLVQAKLGDDATKKTAEAALDAVLAAISDAVLTDKVQLVGFGTFEMKTHPARQGRNPRTGEPIQIPESRSLAFKPSANRRSVVE